MSWSDAAVTLAHHELANNTLQKTLKHKEVTLLFGNSVIHIFHSLAAVHAISCGVDTEKPLQKNVFDWVKKCVLAIHVGLFIVSISKYASQDHKIQLLMCKYIWNDTSSVRPLSVKVDVSNTKEHVRDGKR